jgi:uncharacterized membrane protein YgdD (TMEM256/DUF423 family)
MIDIRIQRIDQLFDSLDPSPFHESEKALRRDAENYIVDFAGEYGRAEPLLLIAHVQCRRRYQRRMRIGRTLLVAGTAVLALALLLRALLGDPGDRAMIVAIGEGLLILGWVAMWRPLEILLFEGLENHQQSALLRRLARIPVDFEFDVTEHGQSKTSARL